MNRWFLDWLAWLEYKALALPQVEWYTLSQKKKRKEWYSDSARKLSLNTIIPPPQNTRSVFPPVDSNLACKVWMHALCMQECIDSLMNTCGRQQGTVKNDQTRKSEQIPHIHLILSGIDIKLHDAKTSKVPQGYSKREHRSPIPGKVTWGSTRWASPKGWKEVTWEKGGVRTELPPWLQTSTSRLSHCSQPSMTHEEGRASCLPCNRKQSLTLHDPTYKCSIQKQVCPAPVATFMGWTCHCRNTWYLFMFYVWKGNMWF